MGTPQGATISPLLANIYLHEVLDEWFVREVRPLLRGQAMLVRYADDFVMVFAREDDARRVWRVLPEWGIGACFQYRMTYPKKQEWSVAGARGKSTDRGKAGRLSSFLWA